MKNLHPGVKHSTVIKFLGAVGTVTGSCTTLRVKIGSKFYLIMVDSGAMLGEGNIIPANLPTGIDVIIATHAHADHIGHLAKAHKANPSARIFAPEDAKTLIRRMMEDAWKCQNRSKKTNHLDKYRTKCKELLGEIIHAENQLFRSKKRGNRGNNTRTSRPHTEQANNRMSLEDKADIAREGLKIILGENYPINNDDVEMLRIAIEEHFEEKRAQEAENGQILIKDVHTTAKSITELPLGTSNTLIESTRGRVTCIMGDSAHLITAPAVGAMLTIRGKNILFSGDRGNPNLPYPYPQPEDDRFAGRANVLVLESTYGGRVHKNREELFQEFDRVVLEAVKNGTDIIIPSISLDRPLVVIYEIVNRLFGIIGKQVEILCFGKLLIDLLNMVPKQHPMWQKIRKYVRYVEDQKTIESFQKKGKKTRIIIAGGGFLPPDGSPAGAVLEQALSQDKLTIIFPNYYGGPDSNAGNLMNGKPFLLTSDSPDAYMLKPGHQTHYMGGFSGHADMPQLVDYAAKVMTNKNNGVIYLNHGTDEARNALKVALEADPRLKAKKVKVYLPQAGRDYVLK